MCEGASKQTSDSKDRAPGIEISRSATEYGNMFANLWKPTDGILMNKSIVSIL